MPTNPTRLATATAAYLELYALHDRHGGVWPDTRDELRAVAVALGVHAGMVAALVADDAVIGALWDIAQESTEAEPYAAAMVAAVDGTPVAVDVEGAWIDLRTGRRLSFDECEALGLDGSGRS